MPSSFLVDDLGNYVLADPQSDLDYSITCWIEGVIFVSAIWTITPAGPTVHDPSINGSPVTIDGIQYATGKVATAWITGLELGKEYVVTVEGTFSGGQVDQRSFRIRCQQL